MHLEQKGGEMIRLKRACQRVAVCLACLLMCGCIGLYLLAEQDIRRETFLTPARFEGFGLSNSLPTIDFSVAPRPDTAIRGYRWKLRPFQEVEVVFAGEI